MVAGFLTRMAAMSVLLAPTTAYCYDISRLDYDLVSSDGITCLRVWTDDVRSRYVPDADRSILIPVRKITKVSKSQHYVFGLEIEDVWSLRIDYGGDKSLTVITYWKECCYYLDGLFTYLEEKLGF